MPTKQCSIGITMKQHVMSHSRNGYSLSTSFLIYILVYHTLFVTVITCITILLVYYSKMCHIYKTWHVSFLQCCFLNQFSNLCLFSCNSSFLPSNSCIFFDMPFCILVFVSWFHLIFLIPIQHRHHQNTNRII